jgi:hypothetical protein
MKYGLVSILFLFACSTAPPAETGEAAPEAMPPEVVGEKEQTEVLEKTGIKNAQNVPSMTRKELQEAYKHLDELIAESNVPSMTRKKLQEAYKRQNKCIKKCTMSRQMEAVGHEVIEQECSKTCMEKHFVGQVAVTPDPNQVSPDKPTPKEGLE